MFEIQKLFLGEFSKSDLKENFYFTGGTALSIYYYNHRESEDIDFFTDKKEHLNLVKISMFFKSKGIKILEYNKKYNRRLFVVEIEEVPLKVKFAYYPFESVFPLEVRKGIKVDFKTEIITNKIAALCDREEEKDIFDIAFFIYKEGKKAFQKVLDDYFEKKFGIPGCKYIVQKTIAGYNGNFDSIKILNNIKKEKIINSVKDFLKDTIREEIDESY